MTAAKIPVQPPIRKLFVPKAPEEKANFTMKANTALRRSPAITPDQIQRPPFPTFDFFTNASNAPTTSNASSPSRIGIMAASQ
ncbi:hypothetical protein D3C71_1813020 [compost metagenome]